MTVVQPRLQRVGEHSQGLPSARGSRRLEEARGRIPPHPGLTLAVSGPAGVSAGR